METKTFINTQKAPQAIGTYSQAVQVGNTVYVSGQIPLIPETMELIEGSIEDEIRQVFKNLQAIAQAANGTLQDIVKLNIFMMDLQHFATVNDIMASYISKPYPARAAVQVAGLPKGVQIEMDAIMVIPAISTSTQ